MKRVFALVVMVIALLLLTFGAVLADKTPDSETDQKLTHTAVINTASPAGIAPGPIFCGDPGSGFVSSTPGTTIADNAVITDTITVSGLDPVLMSVAAQLDISHTFASDLEIFLVSPGGTRVTLTTDNGGGNDNVFAPVTFVDTADIPVTDAAYSNLVSIGAVVPEGALHALIGEDPNGVWTLEVGDDAGVDTGTFNSWSLSMTTLPAMPTIVNTYSVSGTPGAAISDNTTISDTLAMSAADTFIWDVSLDVDITHTWASDLEFTLTSPAGIVSTMSTDNGGSNDDVFSGTTFTDSAADTVTDHAYTNLVTATPLIPEESMGAFFGQDPNGDWTFSLLDDAGGDQGTINNWSVQVTTAACAPTDVSLTSFGSDSASGSLLPAAALLLLAVVGMGGLVLRRKNGA